MAMTHRAARSPTSPIINLTKLSGKAPRLRIPASNHWAVTRSGDRKTIVSSASRSRLGRAALHILWLGSFIALFVV
jgi:hypothetical protein